MTTNVVIKGEEKFNTELVDEALVEIKKIFINHQQGYLLDVANYIAEKFFGNDEKRIRARKPIYDKSFKKLCERLKEEDSKLPQKSWLYAAVNVFQDNKYLKQLGNDEIFQTYGNLSPSAQVELTRIKDPKKKIKLIEEAGEKKLTVRVLRDRVSKVNSRSRGIKNTNDNSVNLSPFNNEVYTIIDLLKKRRTQVKRSITKGRGEVDLFEDLENELDKFIKLLEEKSY